MFFPLPLLDGSLHRAPWPRDPATAEKGRAAGHSDTVALSWQGGRRLCGRGSGRAHPLSATPRPAARRATCGATQEPQVHFQTGACVRIMAGPLESGLLGTTRRAGPENAHF